MKVTLQITKASQAVSMSNCGKCWDYQCSPRTRGE